MNRRAAMASPLIALTQPAQAQVPLRIFAAGPGSAFLPYAEGLAAYLRQGGIPAEARTSAGSLQNLALVQDDPLALGTAFLGSVQDALQGSQAAGGRRHVAVRALFPMYETAFHIAALTSSGLTRFNQLNGKRVGAGPARGPAESFLRAAAEAAGIHIEVVSGDPSAMTEGLLSGAMDALWQGAIVPIPSLVAVLGRAPAIIFGPGNEVTARVIARMPYLAPSNTPAGSYAGQGAPVASFAAWNFVIANAALSDATAYAITRQVLSAANPAAEIHSSAAATRAANAVNNRIMPFHPGALRYFREVGFELA
ncbi:TAXI family TRAP transporter solute-binding subunit [Rhodovarius sp.]|uniref:TAXI family TRAP transporter solute-binding subunit n=1 Tax=Rhodovarius sp. TaxID=2972673 RepID=UPI00333FD130